MALLLRPSMLDDLGLVPALKWQAREVSKRTSMDVSVAAEFASDEFPDEYKTCIYRVVQEALHNVSHHSHATTVRIRVQQEPDRLTLSIQDDGQGFDIRQIKGLGLLGIQERVTRLGGRAAFTRRPEAEPCSRWNCRSVPPEKHRNANAERSEDNMKQIRILLADDHTVMRRGLQAAARKSAGVQRGRRGGRWPAGGGAGRGDQSGCRGARYRHAQSERHRSRAADRRRSGPIRRS